MPGALQGGGGGEEDRRNAARVSACPPPDPAPPFPGKPPGGRASHPPLPTPRQTARTGAHHGADGTGFPPISGWSYRFCRCRGRLHTPGCLHAPPPPRLGRRAQAGATPWQKSRPPTPRLPAAAVPAGARPRARGGATAAAPSERVERGGGRASAVASVLRLLRALERRSVNPSSGISAQSKPRHSREQLRNLFAGYAPNESRGESTSELVQSAFLSVYTSVISSRGCRVKGFPAKQI